MQERGAEPSDPTVVDEVVIVERYEDSENGYEEPEQPGFVPD
jgi:hypothetical protein